MNRISSYMLRRPEKAFSLVELLVGLGIVGILMVAVVASLFNFTEGRQIERTKSAVRQQVDLLSQRVRDDFENIARTYGSLNDTAAGNTAAVIRWGIERVNADLSPAGPRLAANESDNFVFYISNPVELSAPIAHLGGNNFSIAAGTTIRVPEGTPINESVIRAWNAQRYIDQIIASGTYDYYLINSETHALIVTLASSAIRADDANVRDIVLNLPAELDPSEAFFQQSISIRPVTRVEYLVDPVARTLTRTERRLADLDLDPFQQETLVENLDLLQVNFTFADNRPINVTQVGGNIPGIAVSHPSEIPGGLNVRWSDVHSLNVAISTRTPDVFSGDFTDAAIGGGFAQQGIDLTYRSNFSTRVTSYDFEVGQVAGTTEGDCFPTDPNSRCNPDCAHVYDPDNTDRASPLWGGYGDLEGDYCKCGNGDDPESTANFNSVPALSWAGGAPSNEALERVEACIRSLALSCDSPWVERDPRLMLLCNDCITGDTRNTLAPSFSTQNFSRWGETPNFDSGWANVLAAMTSLTNHGNASETGFPRAEAPEVGIINRAAYNDFTCLSTWETCDPISRERFPGVVRNAPTRNVGGAAGTVEAGAFRNLCRCETHIVNEAGVTSQGVRRTALWHDALCSPAACPMHYNGSSWPADYKLTADFSTPGHGLVRADIDYCSCRTAAGATSRNGIADMRSAVPSTELGLPSADASNDIALASILQPDISIDGQSITGGNRCTSIDCDYFSGVSARYGCCAESRNRLAAAHRFFVGPDAARADFNVPATDRFSSYCAANCRQDSVTFAIRSSLFNATDDPPPTYCNPGSGPPPGGGGGNVPAL